MGSENKEEKGEVGKNYGSSEYALFRGQAFVFVFK